jgi:hypothetical protein
MSQHRIDAVSVLVVVLINYAVMSKLFLGLNIAGIFAW